MDQQVSPAVVVVVLILVVVIVVALYFLLVKTPGPEDTGTELPAGPAVSPTLEGAEAPEGQPEGKAEPAEGEGAEVEQPAVPEAGETQQESSEEVEGSPEQTTLAPPEEISEQPETQ